MVKNCLISIIYIFVLVLTAQGREAYPTYNRNGTFGGYYQTNQYNGNISVYSPQNRYVGRLAPSPQGYNQYNPYGGFSGQIRTDRNLHRNRW